MLAIKKTDQAASLVKAISEGFGRSPLAKNHPVIPTNMPVVGGSDLCRKALWQWVFTRLEPVPA